MEDVIAYQALPSDTLMHLKTFVELWLYLPEFLGSLLLFATFILILTSDRKVHKLEKAYIILGIFLSLIMSLHSSVVLSIILPALSSYRELIERFFHVLFLDDPLGVGLIYFAITLPIYFLSAIAWDDSIKLSVRYLMILAFGIIMLPIVSIGSIAFFEQVVFKGDVCLGLTCPAVMKL